MTEQNNEKPALTKARKSYFRQHEKTVRDDLWVATKRKDFTTVEAILNEYGSFLTRHPEALSV